MQELGGDLSRYSIVAFTFLFLVSSTGSKSSAEELPWVSKKPGEWTLEDAEAVLWQSPWVKFKTHRFFDGRGRVREAKFYVRILTALPIRLALAEAYSMQPEDHVYRVERIPAEQIARIANQIEFPGEIVFSLIAFPPSLHRRLNEQNPEAIRENVYLQIGETRIELNQYVPPERTTFGEAWFRFPRPDLSAHSDKIRFQAALKVPWDIKLGLSFSPEDLVFQGEPSY